MTRFRTLDGSMMVISPENEITTRPVKIVWDAVNECLGIQLVGESQLKGYCFFVADAALKKTRHQGQTTDHLKAV